MYTHQVLHSLLLYFAHLFNIYNTGKYRATIYENVVQRFLTCLPVVYVPLGVFALL